MTVLGSSLLAGSSGNQGYNITKSLRLRSSASAYLNRTPAGAGNRKTWTLSFWMKLGSTNVSTYGDDIFFVNGGSGASTLLNFAYDKDSGVLYTDVTGTRLFQTNAVFRDFSAWYHVVLAFDSTQATSTDRIKLYINNVLQTFSTYNAPTLNADYAVNGAYQHNIGRDPTNSWFYLDAYLAEMNLVDGQQLTASSFGETDGITGVWKAKKYGGTYGTNGFYLPFTDVATTSGSNAGLGKDFSGNGNYWNTNNISVTAGTTYDSMTDVPTLTDATTANYCVINSTTAQPTGWGAATTFSNANLTGYMPNAGTDAPAYGTIALPRSGKWYWEVAISSSTVPGAVGVSESSMKRPDGTGPLCRTLYSGGGTGVSKAYDGTNLTGSYTYFSNATLGVACDMDNGKLFFSVNGTYVNSGDPVAGTGAIFTDLLSANPAGGSWLPMSFGYNGHVHNHNYGQQPFSYTPPTGFVALNTYNLPEPSIKAGNKHMDATTYSGNGTSQTITNSSGFAPDFVWIKGRNYADNQTLWNTVVGAQKSLSSDTTTAETTRTTALTGFVSNGFTLGTDTIVNYSAGTYVGWQWKAGGTAVSNTAGSITSTVSANPTAGFSIVTYNTGSAGNQTVGHGLGVTPAMIIIKSRVSTTAHWDVWHKSFANPAQGYLYLNLTNAVANDSRNWANAAPTSSVFSFESGYEFSANANYVAYCWAEVAGYSKFGSYTGNGSTDGTFVHLGFRPKFLMVKCSSNSSTNWFILDTTRDTYNLSGQSLMPNLSNAEYTPASSGYFGDILSNGFKWRDASNNANNASGYTYIYMAFAENPFKYSLAR